MVQNNKTKIRLFLLTAALLIFLGAGCNKKVAEGTLIPKEKAIMDDGNSMIEESHNGMMSDEMKSDSGMMADDEKMMQEEEKMMESTTDSGKYETYSASAFSAASDKKRVLFFHASWCPTCKVADKDFISNLSSLPTNVVLLKIDYDTENTLKKQYGITYQHTFVQVDSSGNEIAKWNGGGIAQLSKNIK